MSARNDEAKRLAIALLSVVGDQAHIKINHAAADMLLELSHAVDSMEAFRDAALNVAEANAKSGAAWVARVQELELQLEAIGAGGVEPLRQPATDPVRAEMLEVLREVWSECEYDLPGSLPERIKAVITKAEAA